MNTSVNKEAARKAAFARRKLAHGEGQGARAAARLLNYLRPHQGKIIAAYMPIRTEISPLSVMTEMAKTSRICVPVIQGAGQVLVFREWLPGCVMIDGPFGAKVPAQGDWLVPELVIVPLVAFDCKGARLGYGGGFYDRSLAALRAQHATLAIGFAYAAQEADILPQEPTDQPLDTLVNERAVVQF